MPFSPSQAKAVTATGIQFILSTTCPLLINPHVISIFEKPGHNTLHPVLPYTG